MISTREKYALIGAGPAGLAGARNLQRFDISFDGYESYSEVGGLWNIDNPRSTVYHTAHLISSKTTTQFEEFPMDKAVADYPKHDELCAYFKAFANHFNLNDHYHFNTRVTALTPEEGYWKVALDNGENHLYRGVIIANGTLAEPNMPEFEGRFSGDIFHSSAYKSPRIFAGKKVLIIGAGNSGCDIAVDAVHHAASVTMSVRRGYHFVPKYVLGRPADTMGGLIKLPPRLKQAIDGALLKLFTGDPVRLGFPKPDHRLYESHPIINTLVLYHLGHGDLSVLGDVERFEDKTVHFKDGHSQAFDTIVLCTGYKLHYPFIEKALLNWEESAPKLYLNCFHPQFDNLFVLGMVEAAGIGWQGRYEQAELIARFICAAADDSRVARDFRQVKSGNYAPLNGGYNYVKLDRMAYYVHKDTYMKAIRKHIKAFRKAQ